MMSLIHSRASPGRLTGKDLINTGIYSAIYFVMVMALAMTGYIPVNYGRIRNSIFVCGFFHVWLWGNFIPQL